MFLYIGQGISEIFQRLSRDVSEIFKDVSEIWQRLVRDLSETELVKTCFRYFQICVREFSERFHGFFREVPEILQI